MKNIIKFFGLLSLIGFSFFYTDKVMDVIAEQDEIMIKITNTKDNYYISPKDATIKGNFLIPGSNGREVDTEKSYNNMKSIGIYNENYFKFKTINPQVSMYDNYDKYISSGNTDKHMISLIFLLNDNTYLNKLYKIIEKENIKINFFIDYNFLNNNSTLLKELPNTHFYSYGLNGTYTPDILLFENNLIERITKQEANFCLSIEENKTILELCKNYEMFTIIPSLSIENNTYISIKDNVNSGDIILIELNSNNLNSLELAIDYIQGKGYEFSYLDELLNEEI